MRCEQGDFECLGYGHHKGTARPLPPRQIRPRPPITLAAKKSETNPSHIFKPLRAKASSEETTSPESSTQATESLPNSSPSSSSETYFQSQPTSPYSDHYTKSLITASYPGLSGSSSNGLPIKFPLSPRQLSALYSQIPHLPSDPTMAILSSPQFEDYILLNFGRMLDLSYFKPVKDQKQAMFKMTIARLRTSPITRWFALLDTKLCASVIEGTLQPQLYIDWIRDLEIIVKDKLVQDSPSKETRILLANWLSVLIIRTVLVPSPIAIQVLRNTAPIFLQTAYSYPELWPENADLTCIPLVSIATSKYHELSMFVAMDCTCAVAFGVPQQVEYDVSCTPLSSTPHPHEWIHGTPTEFLVLLAEINASRDGCPRARGWKDIEHELVTWMGRPTQHDETWESWMVVAWLAVQESWRLTLLAYLYLAVCGASSDEPRVQMCVSQILQVIGTVKKHESPHASIPFFIQYLIASKVGICASREKHRWIVRNKMLNKTETKFWKVQVEEFVPVLEHLWHGAGSGGRPVRWCDYVYSREVVIPIVL
ncbi:hypothetical protein RHS04_00147 [Rhizoctonia solani]|uniref:Uncharacterized protein n=1 Tax=Rhizoctonia solani TaxID=456999 RepID=A0A8H7HFA2_9AGAM|nr:hypothetical protein RHS04_00147 [Rhizoctonia solani]